MMDSSSAPTLSVHDLACERGERLLFQRLSFTLQPAGLLRVEGGNGQGKTSLLRLLAGLGRPHAGEVRWRGQAIERVRDTYHREMAYLGHANGIKEDLTPEENLRFSAGVQGRPFDAERAASLLQRLGLARSRGLACRVLSFGQRRRVALCGLMLAQARLWVLDEPLTGLDVQAVALVEAVIGEHLAAQGLVVLTTHQPLNLPQGEVQALRIGAAAATPSAEPAGALA